MSLRTMLLVAAISALVALGCSDNDAPIADSGDADNAVDVLEADTTQGDSADAGPEEDGPLVDTTADTTPADAAPDAPGCSCQPGQYCKYAAGCSGAQTCVNTPMMCLLQGDPVCGCNDVTYFSACLAAQGGVTVKAPGVCSGDTACTDSAGCASGEYCNKLYGDCSGPGVCKKKSVACPPPGLTGVCGCDGTTWGNACLAGMGGTSVKMQGDCASGVVCTDSSGCNANEFCSKPHGNCTGLGSCQLKPLTCLTIPNEVCGCDGTTYTNECLAQKAGVAVSYTGACSSSKCSHNGECGGFTLFCQKSDGDCWGVGTCVSFPLNCVPFPGEEVCGCNGVTYLAPCTAHNAGVNIAKSGGC